MNSQKWRKRMAIISIVLILFLFGATVYGLVTGKSEFAAAPVALIAVFIFAALFAKRES